MMRSVQEKAFIAANRPNVRINKITAAPFYIGKETYPHPGTAFFTAAASDAMESGAEIAGLEITMHCHDHGAVYDQKYVRFEGSLYVCDMDGAEYESVKIPTKTVEIVAEPNGYFSVTIPFLLWKSDDAPRDYFQQLCGRFALCTLNNVCVGNQFVEQRTASVMWDITADAATMIQRAGIRFDLADEPRTENADADGNLF